MKSLLIIMAAMFFVISESKSNPPEYRLLVSADAINLIDELRDYADTTPKVGGGQDEHGCYIGAGYTWSEIRKSCIRLFEDAIRLHPMVKDSSNSAVLSAFLIFSKDKKKVEFFSVNNKNLILVKKTVKGKTSWEKSAYKLTSEDGRYLLSKNNKSIYIGLAGDK